MKALWDWLDGNKTLIGMIMLWLVDKQWFIAFAGIPVVDILTYLGGIFAGVGVVHKAIKAAQGSEAEKAP